MPSAYDFSRMSVLVVDDSRFMRSLITTTLRALGVERVVTAENGEDAIAVMSPAATAASMGESMVGRTGVDLIISDYVMPVVDGEMFAKWVRISDKSPDRFLPFVMISAAADRDVLFACRDAGVDEFIAKPFSADSVVKRLLVAIENPRPYIYCPNYFGPDRRRQTKPVETDRRAKNDDDVEILHSGKDIAKMGKGKRKRAYIFKLPKLLKQKLSTGMRPKPGEPLFDPELIAAAEEKIANMETDYADWVGESIDELQQAHHRAIEDPEKSALHFETMNRVALELRGQGGIFGYPLITQFGKSLFDITGEGMNVTTNLLDLIDSHISLVKVVITQKIAGDGGTTGRELLQSLAEAKKKFSEVVE